MNDLDKQVIGRLVIILVIATSLVGCGSFSTKNEGEKTRQDDQRLTGEWRDGCVKSDWLGLTHEKTVLRFSALGDFDKITTIYSDDACNTSATTLAEHGTYASLDKSTVVAGANNINLTITAVTVTGESDDAVKLMNDASYCSITGWQKGQATDVLGKTCLGKSHASGEVSFDIYRLDNNDKRLTLGKGSLLLDKDDASSRPGKLDEQRLFDKQ